MIEPVLAVHRSRKMIREFRLLRPRSAIEAVAMQTGSDGKAVFMAGGVDLVNRMKLGEPAAEVIYLGGIAELGEIAETEDGLRLGSLVTHYRIETSPMVRAHFPELADTWRDVANIRIRFKGTIGGNIISADPGYDFALAAIAAGAQLHFLGPDRALRTVSAVELGDISRLGLLTAINLPLHPRPRLVFDRSLRPAVTLALGLGLDHGEIVAGRIAIGCAYAAPMASALPLDEALPPQDLAERAQSLAHRVAASLPEPIADNHAGTHYRRRMIEVLLRRNLLMLADRPT
jgi:aerobic carbon-monoxide dehydrogenase medium subunit